MTLFPNSMANCGNSTGGKTQRSAKKITSTSIKDATKLLYSLLPSPHIGRKFVNLASEILLRKLPAGAGDDPQIDLAWIGYCIRDRKVVISEFKDRKWRFGGNAYISMIELIGKLENPAACLIGTWFVEKLLRLLHSEDECEKGSVQKLVASIYDKFPDQRKFIRNRVFDEIREFSDQKSVKHNGIRHLLFLLGIIVKDLDFDTLQAEFGEFPARVLIPLFRSKWILMFYPDLTDCILEFVKKNPKIADKVIMGILKQSSVVAGDPKDCIFLDAVDGVLQKMSASGLEPIIAPLLQQTRRCLSSPLYMVVERALLLLKRVARLAVGVRFPMNRNVRAELLIVFSGLVKIAMNYWKVRIRKLSRRALYKYWPKLVSQLAQGNSNSDH